MSQNIDLEKGIVEHDSNSNDLLDDDVSYASKNRLQPLRPNETNKTFCTITHDGDTIYLGDLAFDRNEFSKLFPQSQQSDYHSSHRPTGNPIPLGLCGYAISTFCLGFTLLDARGASNPKLLISSSLMFSGLVTLISGLWCLVLDNTFAATALGAFGGFYLSYAVILIDAFNIQSSYTTTEEFNNVMGFWLTGWTMYAFSMWLNTLKGTVEFSVLIGEIVLYLLTLTIYYFTGSAGCQKAAGVFAILSALTAFYLVWSMNATEETSHVIPPVLTMPYSSHKSLKLKGF